jgi:hypothetical protein
MANHHSIAQIEAALRKADGRPAAAARILGISRQAMHERVARTPRLQECITEIEQTLLDLAEGVIIKAVRAGHFPTIKWFLDRRGRKRGYGRAGDEESSMPQADIERLITQLGGDVEIYRRTLRLQSAR